MYFMFVFYHFAYEICEKSWFTGLNDVGSKQSQQNKPVRPVNTSSMTVRDALTRQVRVSNSRHLQAVSSEVCRTLERV
jgi:hypothetical protein